MLAMRGGVMSTWFANLLEAHPELALDSVEDRATLERHFYAALPGQAIAAAIGESVVAVLNQRGLICDMGPKYTAALTRECGNNAAQSVLFTLEDHES